MAITHSKDITLTLNGGPPVPVMDFTLQYTPAQTIDLTSYTSTNNLTTAGTILYDLTVNTANAANSLQTMTGAIQQLGNAYTTAAQSMGRRVPPSFFNKYVNASDLMEEFIAFLGEEGVRQSEVFGLPVELFIKWLIIRACEEDQEEPNVVLELPAPIPQPRCLGCQKYMAKATVLPLHGDRCASLYFARSELVAA